MPEIPALIAIDHDQHHADLIGHLPDGRQFFITTPFEWSSPNNPGREFVALYLFNAAGQLLEARIDDFGPRAGLNREARDACIEGHLQRLGEFTFGRIEMAPFQIERFGLRFGLIPNAPIAGDEDHLSISLMPGDYMAFHEPWDSGEYDT